MTRWLQAARDGHWRTDKLTELTEPNRTASMNPKIPPKRGFCQYRQSVSTAANGVRPVPIKSVPSVVSVCQYGQGGKIVAISRAVASAFEDYAATDNPHDPRAWI